MAGTIALLCTIQPQPPTGLECGLMGGARKAMPATTILVD